ncbi:MAG: adenylyltransferase/cytidyltransferase family protein [Lentisphaeria bacterium]|nr:adenylyltransferase/cytidyltransferase family protein [Lentisphaeria bacterium]
MNALSIHPVASRPRQPETKHLTFDEALEWRRKLGRDKARLGVTNGCFDLLHRGHADYLAKARLACDRLLVLVNSDDSIRQVKGPGRPVVHEDDRVYMLGALECVDAVVMFTSKHCTDLFERIKPDVYIKGGDYTEETLVREEYLLLKSLGVEFVFIPFVPGLSTTGLIERIQTLP